MIRQTITATAVLLLAACGGGGGGQPAAVSLDSIRDLTGAATPTETVAAQDARAASIVSRSDSLIVSTAYMETSDPDLPEFRLRAQCTGARCLISEPRSGYSDTITLSDLELAPGSVDEAVGTKHGITLISSMGSDRASGLDATSFGAWMDHSAFEVEMVTVAAEGISFSIRIAAAAGDLTGIPLTGRATWLGLMVGTPATGSNRGDRLMGDAALNYDMSAGGLDVAFSSIKNIDRGAAHSTPTVLFADVPIDSLGTFAAGLAGNRIQGGFYGPDHVEAAGIFEQRNIVGAFGARRADQ